MRKDKLVEINGRRFEYNEKHLTMDDLCNIAHRTKRLTECYAKPSIAKVEIYNNWQKWFFELSNAFYFGIDTYNSNIFTLTFIIEDVELFGNPVSDYVVHITPCHNYITRVLEYDVV